MTAFTFLDYHYFAKAQYLDFKVIRFLISIGFCLITSCASEPGSDSSQKSIRQQVFIQQHSAPMEVTSSHGTSTIEPVVVSYPETSFSDPFESINRPIFVFNDVVYRYALVPLSKGYMNYTPRFVRSGTSNFFSNLGEPFNSLNHLFQLEGKSSVVNIGRFLINSTIGILGLFNPATHWFDIQPQDTSLNETLASYDVGYGAFLVLPILGMTDTRNTISTLAESYTSPLNSVTENPQTFYLKTYGEFNDIAPSLIHYEELRAQNDDPYQYFRNLYLQSVIRDEQFKQVEKDKIESKTEVDKDE